MNGQGFQLRNLRLLFVLVQICLGSGLFSLSSAERNAINVGLGSDVGGGTLLSMLSNMNDAYKILRLRSEEFSPLKAFYLATLGG